MKQIRLEGMKSFFTFPLDTVDSTMESESDEYSQSATSDRKPYWLSGDESPARFLHFLLGGSNTEPVPLFLTPRFILCCSLAENSTPKLRLSTSQGAYGSVRSQAKDSVKKNAWGCSSSIPFKRTRLKGGGGVFEIPKSFKSLAAEARMNLGSSSEFVRWCEKNGKSTLVVKDIKRWYYRSSKP